MNRQTWTDTQRYTEVHALTESRDGRVSALT